MAQFRFDHGVIVVTDLNTAMEDYRKLGFTVNFGGKHAGGKTQNALIIFADGSYLELLAPIDVNFLDNMDTVDMSHFLDFVAQGDGWAGFALQTTELESSAKAMRGLGVQVSQLTPGSRQRPDGKVIKWNSVSVDNSRTPFFIQDETDRTLRVPTDPAITTHENGATGVASMVIATHKLERAVDHFQTMLGIPAQRPGPAIAAAETASFAVGEVDLILAAPDKFDSPFQAYVDERGEVPYEIRLRTSQADQAGHLNYRKLHKARIQLIH